MVKHTSTDPACIYYHPPRSRLERWRFDRARGRGCAVCMGSRYGLGLPSYLHDAIAKAYSDALDTKLAESGSLSDAETRE
jgi:hypothetical protein